MKKLFYSLLLLIGSAMLFTSCSSSNDQGKLVPGDAALVVVIKGKNLMEKLPWSEIKQNPAIQELLGDSSTPSEARLILENPENSGIDINNDLVIFLKNDSSTSAYLAFEGKLKDAAKFKAFNETMLKKKEVTEKDGISFLKNGEGCVSWKKDQFIYVAATPGFNGLGGRRSYDEETESTPKKSIDAQAICTQLFALDEAKSLAKEKRFTRLMESSGDAHLWMNSEQFYRAVENNRALLMFNLEKIYKGSVTTASLTFDNGKITVNTNSYSSEELAKIIDKYGGGKVNEDLLKSIPGKEVQAVFAMNFKPEGLKEFLKLLNLDGYLNIATAQLGFNMDDFIKANKGDLLFALTDLHMQKDTSYQLYENTELSTISRPAANFYFVTSIGDKDAFNKLINAGNKLAGSAFGGIEKSIGYSSNGTLFALSNSKENAEKYLAGTKTNHDFISKISGESIGAYVNVQSILKNTANGENLDSLERQMMDVNLKFWDQIIVRGGSKKDDAVQQSFEILLQDKNSNSLKQLNQYATALTKIQQERQKKWQEAFPPAAMDTTVVPAKQ